MKKILLMLMFGLISFTSIAQPTYQAYNPFAISVMNPSNYVGIGTKIATERLTVNGNIVPYTTGTNTLGKSSLHWLSIYSDSMFVGSAANSTAGSYYNATINKTSGRVEYQKEVHGLATFSGTGSRDTFGIAHSMGLVPTYINVQFGSTAAVDTSGIYITVDSTTILIHYTHAPASGSNNVKFYWKAQQ